MITINCETGVSVDFPYDSYQGASFDDAQLHRALLDERNIDNASFRSADLRGGVFYKSSLVHVDFTKATLINADLRFSDLRDAILVEARLIGADLSSACLTGADLTGADVAYAIFADADLRGAIVLCDRINDADLSGAIFDSATKWPSGFVPQNKGAVPSKA